MKNIKKENKNSNKKDFHKSFWSIIALFILLVTISYIALFVPFGYNLGYHENTIFLFFIVVYLFLVILGMILRFALHNKNHYLAKGFMWGAIVLIAIPLILTSLILGVCLVYI